MNTIKKAMVSALLALSALGLTVSLPAFADGASDAAYYCSLCHGLTVNGVAVTPGGGRTGVQRTANEWMTTIGIMRNSFGCSVPAEADVGIADYLASIPPATTTSTTSTTTTSTITTTTLAAAKRCYRPDGSYFYSDIGLNCPPGTSSTPPPTCTDGLPTFDGSTWICPTTSTTVTTVATTTTTTLCNTYVNGTTQYPYSGSGSCHGKSDKKTGEHVVHDEKWCRRNMTQFDSNGNHTHAYPHPVCM